ncbi:MAG: tetratricopeptide repeat protein [Pyrinomonadaceae bacterium]|nr:tetratricopeptide repeat protein [Pyrinomonadaceae bacterium]
MGTEITYNSAHPECVYEFGPFCIDTVKRLLLREGEPVSLTSKGFDTLLTLVERRGQVVCKDELMKILWPDTIVEENNLTQQISMLRKALGERAGEHRFVVTVPGRGYTFVAEVHETFSDESALIVEQHTRSSITLDIEDEQEKAVAPRDTGLRVLPRAAYSVRRGWKSRAAIFAAPVVLIGLALSLASWFTYRAPQPEQSGGRRPSIAVLPFKSLNNDPTNDYLGTGMTDTLIAKLSNIRQISVRPTSSVIKYAGRSQDAQAIGRELGVDSVLEGTIQKAGDRVRVTVQLVNVQDRNPLWAKSFDEEITDIFAVQDTISSQVAQTMLVRLNGYDRKQLSKRETENVEAYQEYLRGRYFWNKRDEAGLKKSVEHFQHAIELDPNYGAAYAGLADAYTIIANYSIKPYDRDETFQRGKALALKAIDVDEALAEAHTSLAFIKAFYEQDDSGAETEFRRALELNPNYATAHHWYSEFLVMRGREQESMTEIKRAQELDPLSPVINVTLGEHLYYGRRYDEAITHLRKTLEISPDFAQASYILGLALEQKGMYKEAISALRKAKESTKLDPSVPSSALGHVYALTGQKGEARKILGELLSTDDPAPYSIGMIYQGLGEKEQAIGWLRKIKSKEGMLQMLLRDDPRLDSLRSDQRFQELL